MGIKNNFSLNSNMFINFHNFLCIMHALISIILSLGLQASEKIEGIFLNLSHLEETLDFTAQAFSRMSKLRLLKVYKSKDTLRNFKDTSNKEKCRVNFSKDFNLRYDCLRCLYLHGYSFKSLPSDFNPKNLVELSMPYSHIQQLWKGIKVR